MALVLLATDDAALHAILDAELACFGFDSKWATDAKEAFEMCLADPPDCLIVDVAIPVYSVWEFCQMIRAHPDLSDSLPIFLIADDALSPRQLEHFEIAEVVRRGHDTSLFRELLFQHVAL